MNRFFVLPFAATASFNRKKKKDERGSLFKAPPLFCACVYREKMATAAAALSMLRESICVGTDAEGVEPLLALQTSLHDTQHELSHARQAVYRLEQERHDALITEQILLGRLRTRSKAAASVHKAMLSDLLALRSQLQFYYEQQHQQHSSSTTTSSPSPIIPGLAHDVSGPPLGAPYDYASYIDVGRLLEGDSDGMGVDDTSYLPNDVLVVQRMLFGAEVEKIQQNLAAQKRYIRAACEDRMATTEAKIRQMRMQFQEACRVQHECESRITEAQRDAELKIQRDMEASAAATTEYVRKFRDEAEATIDQLSVKVSDVTMLLETAQAQNEILTDKVERLQNTKKGLAAKQISDLEQNLDVLYRQVLSKEEEIALSKKQLREAEAAVETQTQRSDILQEELRRRSDVIEEQDQTISDMRREKERVVRQCRDDIERAKRTMEEELERRVAEAHPPIDAEELEAKTREVEELKEALADAEKECASLSSQLTDARESKRQQTVSNLATIEGLEAAVQLHQDRCREANATIEVLEGKLQASAADLDSAKNAAPARPSFGDAIIQMQRVGMELLETTRQDSLPKLFAVLDMIDVVFPEGSACRRAVADVQSAAVGAAQRAQALLRDVQLLLALNCEEPGVMVSDASHLPEILRSNVRTVEDALNTIPLNGSSSRLARAIVEHDRNEAEAAIVDWRRKFKERATKHAHASSAWNEDSAGKASRISPRKSMSPSKLKSPSVSPRTTPPEDALMIGDESHPSDALGLQKCGQASASTFGDEITTTPQGAVASAKGRKGSTAGGPQAPTAHAGAKGTPKASGKASSPTTLAGASTVRRSSVQSLSIIADANSPTPCAVVETSPPARPAQAPMSDASVQCSVTLPTTVDVQTCTDPAISDVNTAEPLPSSTCGRCVAAGPTAAVPRSTSTSDLVGGLLVDATTSAVHSVAGSRPASAASTVQHPPQRSDSAGSLAATVPLPALPTAVPVDPLVEIQRLVLELQEQGPIAPMIVPRALRRDNTLALLQLLPPAEREEFSTLAEQLDLLPPRVRHVTVRRDAEGDPDVQRRVREEKQAALEWSMCTPQGATTASMSNNFDVGGDGEEGATQDDDARKPLKTRLMSAMMGGSSSSSASIGTLLHNLICSLPIFLQRTLEGVVHASFAGGGGVGSACQQSLWMVASLLTASPFESMTGTEANAQQNEDAVQRAFLRATRPLHGGGNPTAQQREASVASRWFHVVSWALLVCLQQVQGAASEVDRWATASAAPLLPPDPSVTNTGERPHSAMSSAVIRREHQQHPSMRLVVPPKPAMSVRAHKTRQSMQPVVSPTIATTPTATWSSASDRLQTMHDTHRKFFSSAAPASLLDDRTLFDVTAAAPPSVGIPDASQRMLGHHGNQMYRHGRADVVPAGHILPTQFTAEFDAAIRQTLVSPLEFVMSPSGEYSATLPPRPNSAIPCMVGSKLRLSLHQNSSYRGGAHQQPQGGPPLSTDDSAQQQPDETTWTAENALYEDFVRHKQVEKRVLQNTASVSSTAPPPPTIRCGSAPLARHHNDSTLNPAAASSQSSAVVVYRGGPRQSGETAEDPAVGSEVRVVHSGGVRPGKPIKNFLSKPSSAGGRRSAVQLGQSRSLSDTCMVREPSPTPDVLTTPDEAYRRPQSSSSLKDRLRSTVQHVNDSSMLAKGGASVSTALSTISVAQSTTQRRTVPPAAVFQWQRVIASSTEEHTDASLDKHRRHRPAPLTTVSTLPAATSGFARRGAAAQHPAKVKTSTTTTRQGPPTSPSSLVEENIISSIGTPVQRWSTNQHGGDLDTSGGFYFSQQDEDEPHGGPHDDPFSVPESPFALT